MKQIVVTLLEQAIESLLKTHALGNLDHAPEISVERTRDPSHGDFASNIALMLAKPARMKPRDIAQAIVMALPHHDSIERIEIAGPGFINFQLRQNAFHSALKNVFLAGDDYGRSTVGANRAVQVEFVSANPTGPLHVGHGRGAAYGAVVADLLALAGFRVHREYYINDAGRQMDILAASVWLRYLEGYGEKLTFPSNGYKGEYVLPISESLKSMHGDAFRRSAAQAMTDLPADEPQGGDKEAHIDAIVERAKTLLGTEDYRKVFDHGLGMIIADIKQDLSEFGVTYDEWFSERSLADNGSVDQLIERLKKSGHAFEKDGALWFRSTDFGDEKDRVVVRDNGQKTYFASDIAYHANKIARGYDQIIDIWGADHHGYIPRVKAALSALGDDPNKLEVLLVQFAILYRGGQKAQMSTRSGEFVTLRQLRHEVGNDAARFFYVMRKCEQHLDFDLDLAKSQSNDNPVYYIQYAHARVCSVFRELTEKGFTWDQANGEKHLQLLHEPHEQALFQMISRFPEVIEVAALNREPHQIAHYLRELANGLHTYYNAHKFIVEDAALRNARLTLVAATKQIIANGLRLLGVSAPQSM